MSNKKNTIYKILGLSQSPLRSVLSPVHIEMNGNREIIIEGYKNIIEYSPNAVKISVKNMVICFCGRNLNIKCLNSDSLIINGFIISVEFVS